MALDESQFYTDPATGTKYTSYASFQQNTQGIPLPSSVNPDTGQAISVDQLNPATAITVPTPTPKPDALAGAAASAQATSKSLDQYIKELTPPETETSKEYDRLSADISSLLPGLGGRGAAQLEAEKVAGIPDQKKQLAELNAQILAGIAEATKVDAEYEKLVQATENQTISKGIAFGQQGLLRRQQLAEKNAKAATLNLLQARALGLQGNIQAAQDAVNRAIDLKYQDRLDEVTIKQQQLDMLKETLGYERDIVSRASERKYQDDSKNESRQYEERIKALDRKYAEEREAIAEEKAKAKYNISLALETGVKTRFANKNGEFFNAATGETAPDPATFFKMAGVKSFEEAYARGLVTDISGFDTLAERKFRFDQESEKFDRSIKLQELDLKAQELKLKNTGITINTDNIPTYQLDTTNGLMDAYNSISVGLTEAQRKSGDTTLANLINRGDIEGAKQFVIATAIKSAPVEQQNKAFGRTEALNALTDISSLLTQYKAKGGDTGFFNGKLEDLANKIGKTQDPDLARIQNQIRLALVDYRRAVSGAAFTETEAAEYNRLFPSIGKVDNFNTAVIQSLTQSFQRNQKSFLQTIVGPTAAESLVNPIKPPIEKLMIDDPTVGAAMNAMLLQGISWDVARDTIYDQLGFKSVGNTTASKPVSTTSGMRTDRHNNPTAFTTDIAKLAGLKLGLDYIIGDSFSNGKYQTAKLLGDPIDTTIKVIDKIGFKTQSGGNRWTYTDSIPETKNWNKLSYEQKKKVIAKMYQHEGGSALRQIFA